MNTATKEERQAFLDGFLDALDDQAFPSREYGGEEQQAAWQAGHDHFYHFVRREQDRLEQAVASGEGLLVEFSSES